MTGSSLNLNRFFSATTLNLESLVSSRGCFSLGLLLDVDETNDEECFLYFLFLDFFMVQDQSLFFAFFPFFLSSSLELLSMEDALIVLCLFVKAVCG